MLTTTLRVAARSAAVMLAMSVAASPAAAADGVTGKWLHHEGKAHIAISKCGTTLCAISQPIGKYADVRDVNNADPKLRSRPMRGVNVFRGMKASGATWVGEVYDPQRGKWLKATLSPLTTNKVSLRGCIAIFCRTVEWTRVN